MPMTAAAHIAMICITVTERKTVLEKTELPALLESMGVRYLIAF